MPTKKLILVLMSLILFSKAVAIAEQDDDAMLEKELHWLQAESYQGQVVTVSKISEKISEAPATIMVITRDDIERHGYTELSQILDDLPAMDVIRPYGDTHFKNYWRGFRNTIGEPFLVMIDGIVYNHLYYNTADIPLITVSLSNIERVEVVYGPASSVYGANAFMGVINVITLKDKANDGASVTVRMSGGSNETRIADLNYFYKQNDLRISLTARFDNGEIDADAAQNYEYLKDKYYADRRLWGGFVDNPRLGGECQSLHAHRSVDLRAYFGATELGAQYYVLNTGYGLVYAADLVQNNSVWKRPEYSLYFRHHQPFGEKVSSTTLLRYRRSDVTNDSYFVDAYFDGTTYVAAFSYWQSLNESWLVSQDFNVTLSDKFSFNLGLEYEQKNLQKAYDVSGEGESGTPGGYEPVSEIDADTYDYPEPPPAVFQSQNHIITEDIAFYIQNRYRLTPCHLLNLGLRIDDNSQYGTEMTIRTSYVANFDQWGVKVLYGEAFQEPVPRLLYGGWTGSGSDPDLDPEESQTVEVSGNYTAQKFSSLVSIWHVHNTKTIVNTPDGAKNLGDRTVVGLDYHIQYQFPLSILKPIKIWAYYSHVFKADETKFSEGIEVGTGDIGDLADNKFWLGTTVGVKDYLLATFRGRYIGERQTVETNPIKSVAAFFTADLNLMFWDFLVKGIGMSLTVNNLFDEEYYHPGIRDAGAGDTPGFFDEDAVWHGSGSYYNSLLPQPGRSVVLSLHLRY
ncbi:TonB-dependent receptor plug domain-containing protein [candidate division CSSED10-310 bacterium]|uniref:TonB-dependent receptor plug domain-containing protein n=1 Tax=candidate division CSSED10-310 bacterium TaxID=2855610 RepID=A0ABV6Z620_UNCC1